MLDSKILNILGCPLEDERPPLIQTGEWLICTKCGFSFPIRDGIPDLLPESAVSPENRAKLDSVS